MPRWLGRLIWALLGPVILVALFTCTSRLFRAGMIAALLIAAATYGSLWWFSFVPADQLANLIGRGAVTLGLYCAGMIALNILIVSMSELEKWLRRWLVHRDE